MSVERELLPTKVVPVHYDVYLKPDLAAFTFQGEVKVQLNVQEETSELVFHSQSLKISSGSVHCPKDGSKIADVVGSPEYNTENATAKVTLSTSLHKGTKELRLVFTGELNDQMAGFYRSKYELNGVTKYMATTQFEPTDARRAFPCWDEPALKATFTITLEVPKALTALGNMPVEAETEGSEGHKKVQFAKTPIMSTYLIAFLVGEFDVVEGKTAEGVAVRVYTPPGKGAQGTFALDMACKTLSYFGEYYGIQYPLPKQDMVAIPDFAAGAMENWGLITYRETALLIDAEKSPVASKQRVAYVVAHELAHQWFGNLVTMEWWKELWLNEGFATFVGNQAVANFYPQWDMWTQFVSTYCGRALELDSLRTSHPIEVEVRTSSQVNEIFDAISYNKGASVIRMLYTYIGEAAFQKGLNIYLKRHQYKNAVTVDLWNAFSEASGKDIRTFMENWTRETGFPVITVTRTATGFTASQSRFLSSGETDDSVVWNVPLNVISSHAPDAAPEIHVLSQASQTFESKAAAGSRWFVVNAHITNFYRVKYEGELLTALGDALKSGELHATDRLGLQSDVFALAAAGKASTRSALELATFYSKETDYTVWMDLLNNIKNVANVWSTEPSGAHFLDLLRVMTAEAAAAVGWDSKAGETDMTALLRGVLIGVSAMAKNEAVLPEARKRFAELKANPKALPSDLRGGVYRAIVRHGGVEEYEEMVRMFKASDMQEEKIRCIGAFSSGATEELIRKALAYGLEGGDVRSQDYFYVIAFASSTKIGRDTTWAFVKERFDTLNKIYGEGQFLFARIIQYAISDFNSEEMAKDVETFFASHPCPAADRTIKQGLEKIRSQAKWLARDRESVNSFLTQKFSQ